MSCAVVLFTRDLRLRDQPALAAAAREAERVVPLFVLDDALLWTNCGAPNRVAFLHDCLRASTPACASAARGWCCAAATRSGRRCGWRGRWGRRRST